MSYQHADHTPVYTYREADDQVSPLPGAHTKNFFQRDGKGQRHYTGRGYGRDKGRLESTVGDVGGG